MKPAERLRMSYGTSPTPVAAAALLDECERVLVLLRSKLFGTIDLLPEAEARAKAQQLMVISFNTLAKLRGEA